MTRSSSTHLEQREEKCRQILVQQQQQLQTRLERIEDDFQQPRNRDDGDRAVERNNDEVLEELGETGQKELFAIAALSRMKEGAFGICAKCRSMSSLTRRSASPTHVRSNFASISSLR